jgi:hypothetical protein
MISVLHILSRIEVSALFAAREMSPIGVPEEKEPGSKTQCPE